MWIKTESNECPSKHQWLIALGAIAMPPVVLQCSQCPSEHQWLIALGAIAMLPVVTQCPQCYKRPLTSLLPPADRTQTWNPTTGGVGGRGKFSGNVAVLAILPSPDL